ncbi:MAG: CRTAC1 family protein [Nitrospirae bacterium]|nr:CRTAC1 family protein [Nitrospirota bacterium]
MDHDGLVDLYFINQVGANALYKNLGEGRFRDITEVSHTGLGDRVGVGGAFADIDNDGDQDLFVTAVRGGNVLLENEGNGVFRDMTESSGLDYHGHSSGAVFFDFDRDGLLDLLVVNVGRYTTDEFDSQGYYVGRERAFELHLQPEFAERSILYKNLGGGRFKDVSREMGLGDLVGWNGDASIADYNNDGYPDLYVTNMQGDDQFFENVGGTRFIEVTPTVFPKTGWGAMGIKFFDFDNDGLIDLMTTDMHSDMFGGITAETMKLPRELAPRMMGDVSHNILGNTFYKNMGDGRYEEMSDAIGAETYWPWGISVEDLDADQYQDVFVASGMGYPFPYAKNVVLINEKGERFRHAEKELNIEPRANGTLIGDYFALDCGGRDQERVECSRVFNTSQDCVVDGICYRNGFVSGARSSRSSVIFDLDNDGDLDIVTTEFNDVPQVLVSNLAQRRRIHYLKMELVGTASNRNAIGAWVSISYGGNRQVRYIDGKSGYLSQSQIPIYFGLGEHRTIDRVDIIWPTGRHQAIQGPFEANRTIQIIEP